MQNRFKSSIVWIAVLAQVLLIINLYNPNLTEDIKIVGTAIIEVLTLLGVLNNPVNKEGF